MFSSAPTASCQHQRTNYWEPESYINPKQEPTHSTDTCKHTHTHTFLIIHHLILRHEIWQRWSCSSYQEWNAAIGWWILFIWLFSHKGICPSVDRVLHRPSVGSAETGPIRSEEVGRVFVAYLAEWEKERSNICFVFLNVIIPTLKTEVLQCLIPKSQHSLRFD